MVLWCWAPQQDWARVVILGWAGGTGWQKTGDSKTGDSVFCSLLQSFCFWRSPLALKMAKMAKMARILLREKLVRGKEEGALGVKGWAPEP